MPLTDKLRRLAARSLPIAPLRAQLPAPIASISFDDIPASAARVGAPILEAAGVRGTFYICGSHQDQSFEGRAQFARADIEALHAAGHEIACHTFSHPHVPALDKAGIDAEIVRNAAYVSAITGAPRMESFAYPYGDLSPASARHCASRFTSCRDVIAGVNAGTFDMGRLKSLGLETRKNARADVARWIDATRHATGWLILFTHDVDPKASAHGCTPQELAHTIADIQAAGIEIVTVAEGARRVRAAAMAAAPVAA